jgi:hypothetical protein
MTGDQLLQYKNEQNFSVLRKYKKKPTIDEMSKAKP